jgi:diguanylate cyclase (GGDEF)-like protein/putative nucleotidyltransferase with HDIG domain
MDSQEFRYQEIKASTSVWLALLTAPLVLAPGLTGLVELPFAQQALLSLTVFVSGLLVGHEWKVPRLGSTFAAEHLLVFWGILNVGFVGGVVVAAALALFHIIDNNAPHSTRLKATAAEFAGAGAAGLAFGSVFTASAVSDTGAGVLIPGALLSATVVMLFAHYAVLKAVGWILTPVSLADVDRGRLSATAARSVGGQVLTGGAAIVLFAAFRHFGYEFALVVVPLILLGHVFYQVHVRSLAQKTKETVDAGRLHLATVEALATAIDARDQVDVGHVRRTQIYSVGIGVALGLREGELNALRSGALLHDIGKLAVPEHILNKPGRLTPAELEKTKIHSVVGASILGKVGFPYPVVPTVKHHHEYWDGSGYPSGLSGERIPVTARILAIADTYDALRGMRPYRKPLSREDACSFLRSRAGTQFDPHIVSTFLRNLTKLEADIEMLGFGYPTGVEHENKAARDVTVGPDYVEQIKQANQEVFALYEMARDFGATLDLDEVFMLLSRKVCEFVPYDTCLIYLLDDSGDFATAAYVEGRNSDPLNGKRINVGEGATGYVLKKCKPVENVDPSLDFAFSHPEICGHYVGMASVPLLAEDKLIGAISVFSGDLAVYEEEHLRLLETIARIAADAISKSVRHAENEVHAMTDQLTGLPNARSFQFQFERESGRAGRSGSSLQLLMMDLDGFKAVNDTMGHQAGDRLLKEIGAVVRSELREYDFLARYGGDEFVALVPETDTADVIELCTRIEAAVGAYAIAFKGPPVGVSIGAASFPAQGETFEQLLIAADKAMYRTKAFHKQRLMRLSEEVSSAEPSLTPGFDPDGIDAARLEMNEPGMFGTDLIVELDDRHIVTVNSVN